MDGGDSRTACECTGPSVLHTRVVAIVAPTSCVPGSFLGWAGQVGPLGSGGLTAVPTPTCRWMSAAQWGQSGPSPRSTPASLSVPGVFL